MALERRIKDAATAAFKDNSKLAEMTEADRLLAAEFYSTMAELVHGKYAELAKLYNLERARFLLGTVERIAATAHAFAAEKGIDG